MDVISELLLKTRKILAESKFRPFKERIFLYIFLTVSAIVVLLSAAFCAIMLWLLIDVLISGELFDNEPVEEWDIR